MSGKTNVKFINKIFCFLRTNKKTQQNTENALKNTNKVVKGQFERCVICGVVTSTSVSMPIALRKNYELGCGQMCANCARELQKEAKNI